MTETAPTTPLDVLYRACRACAENIAEFGALTDPDILDDLARAVGRVYGTTEIMTTSAEVLDNAMVDALAAEMKAKLARAREKGRGGWENPAECSVRDLWDMLVVHAHKPNLDMVDVANLAGMIRWRLLHVLPDPVVLSEHVAAIAQRVPAPAQALSALLEGQVQLRVAAAAVLAEFDGNRLRPIATFAEQDRMKVTREVVGNLRAALAQAGG